MLTLIDGPFTHLVLEYNLSEKQIEEIYDLIDEVFESLKVLKPMSHNAFELRVYESDPSQNGNYHFAEQIVNTLNLEERYEDVYKHMKKNGMNLK